MLKVITMYINELNFVIAALALATAIYSIFYTRRFNRHKISVNNGVFYSDANNLPIAWFEVHNISPSPVTVLKIEFFELGSCIHPVMCYEPIQTYSSTAYDLKIPDIIPEYMHSEPLDPPQILHPHSYLELGYYFDHTYDYLMIKVTCEERIHHFRKTQTFNLHFSYVEN